eukprot:g4300.t1
MQISSLFLCDHEHVIRVLHTWYVLAAACPKLLKVEINYECDKLLDDCKQNDDTTTLSSLTELENWCPVRARATTGSRAMSQAWLENRIQTASLQEHKRRDFYRSRRICWTCHPCRCPPDFKKILCIKRYDRKAFLSYKYKRGVHACRCGQTYFALDFAMHRLPYFFELSTLL